MVLSLEDPQGVESQCIAQFIGGGTVQTTESTDYIFLRSSCFGEPDGAGGDEVGGDGGFPRSKRRFLGHQRQDEDG